jgi:hypothetical protein
VTIRNRLLAGTLALFVLRALLSLIRTGPVLVADEIGYLDNARALAGGVAGQLEIAPFYRGGYSLALAPLVALGSSPTLTYHLILLLNVALAAAVLPLLYLLLTRFGGVRAELAFWAALAGAAYPALTVLSQTAMSENALFPLVCVWLIAFAGLLARPAPRSELWWGVGLAASTGALWAVHTRMAVAVALAVLGLVWLTARRRIRPSTLVVALATIALFLLGTHFLDNFLADHNYGGSAPDELSERMDALSSIAGVRTVLANLVGQTWYLLVATFGLAAAVAVDFFARWRARPGGAVAGEGQPPYVGILLALTALLLVISASAFPERTRPDMLIYGRYSEVVAPALVAVGLTVLARARIPSLRRLAWPLLGFVLLTGVVALIRATASDPDAANRWNVSALPFVTVQLGPAILVAAALVAAVGAALLLRGAALGPRPLGLVALGLFLAVMAYGAWNPVRSSQRAVYPAGWKSPEDAAAAAGIESVGYDLDHYDTIGLYTVQWFLPITKVTLFHGKRQQPPSRYVLSGEGWAREHPATKAEPLWSAVGRDETLWRLREPGSQ